MNVYVVSFDPQVTPLYAAHNAIANSPLVREWWHFLAGTYIVTTLHTQTELDQNIKSKWPGGSILIMKASKQTSGLLPKDAWNWINSKTGL